MLLNSSFEKKESPIDFYYLAGFLLLFLFINDHLIAVRPFFPSQIWALYDGVVHGLTGVIVLYPIYKEKISRYFPVLFLLASLVDLDHFIVAQSFSLYDALQLPVRPVIHSITFAIMAALSGFLLTGKKLISWTLLAALTSHIIRDAAGGGTPIFWPLEIYRIPSWLYYGIEIVLLYFSFQVSRIQGEIISCRHRFLPAK